MEPGVISMFSSSPPPMDDPPDDDEDEFGDFGTFNSVPNSVSFSEFETPTTFNQTQALNATSPPDISRALISSELAKANGHVGKSVYNSQTNADTLTNGFQGSPQKSDHFGPENEEGFADFAAFSDKQLANEDSGGTLDETQSQDFIEHSAVQTENADSNRTDPEFTDDNFASFSEKDTNKDKQLESVDSQREFTDDPSQTETSNPNRTEPEFPDFSAFPEECTLENNFTTGSESTGVSKEQDATSAQPHKDCSSLNGNDFDASACSSASESECGVVEISEKRVLANGTSEKDRDVSSETETETSFGRPLSTDALEEFGDMSTTGSVPSPPLQEETATPTGEDEDFGEFGDAQEFGNFEQNKALSDGDEDEEDDFGDFGDFNSPREEQEEAEPGFPESESFGNFGSASAEEREDGWRAFGNEARDEGESWATFGSEPKEEPSNDSSTASLSARLEKVFVSSFPPSADEEEVEEEEEQEEDIMNLRLFLEPGPAHTDTHRSLCVRVWAQLQDIHEALGLRYQWGGSYCNKTLLCCLGIDTRNILFTGQKKQPVIVPMYAAGLGMLEPVKPVSAAEMIASIGQNSSCSSSVQEALPPVQFDWSSSGLTNPLDGVDPELFELTTAKLDSNKVTDAFARLMSTVQSTSTSTRRPQREENLSSEAEKVISLFPDLSFMNAKVLMFPTTLTPHTTAEGSRGPGLDRD